MSDRNREFIPQRTKDNHFSQEQFGKVGITSCARVKRIIRASTASFSIRKRSPCGFWHRLPYSFSGSMKVSFDQAQRIKPRPGSVSCPLWNYIWTKIGKIFSAKAQQTTHRYKTFTCRSSAEIAELVHQSVHHWKMQGGKFFLDLNYCKTPTFFGVIYKRFNSASAIASKVLKLIKQSPSYSKRTLRFFVRYPCCLALLNFEGDIGSASGYIGCITRAHCSDTSHNRAEIIPAIFRKFAKNYHGGSRQEQASYHIANRYYYFNFLIQIHVGISSKFGVAIVHMSRCIGKRMWSAI